MKVESVEIKKTEKEIGDWIDRVKMTSVQKRLLERLILSPDSYSAKDIVEILTEKFSILMEASGFLSDPSAGKAEEVGLSVSAHNLLSKLLGAYWSVSKSGDEVAKELDKIEVRIMELRKLFSEEVGDDGK